MDLRLVDALTKSGFTGIEIYEFEQCKLHDFKPYVTRNRETVHVQCTKCLMSDEVALLMGLSPKYYHNKEEYV